MNIGHGVIADMKHFISVKAVLGHLKEFGVWFFDSFFEAGDDFVEIRCDAEKLACAVEADIPVGEHDDGKVSAF